MLTTIPLPTTPDYDTWPSSVPPHLAPPHHEEDHFRPEDVRTWPLQEFDETVRFDKPGTQPSPDEDSDCSWDCASSGECGCYGYGAYGRGECCGGHCIMCYKSVYFAACEDINVYVPLEEGVDRRLEVCNEVSFRTGQAACAWDEETSLCETSLPFWFLPLMIASIILCLLNIAVYMHFPARRSRSTWTRERDGLMRGRRNESGFARESFAAKESCDAHSRAT